MDQIKNELDQLLEQNINNSSDIKKLFHTFFFNTLHLKRSQHLTWHILHLFSVLYPDSPSKQLQENTKLSIINLKKNLPFCSTCSYNSKDTFIENNNIDLAVSNKNELILFFINYHSYINTSFTNNKTYDSSIFTLEYVINKYSDNTYYNYFKIYYDIDLLQIIFEKDAFSLLHFIKTIFAKKIMDQIKNITFDINFKIK